MARREGKNPASILTMEEKGRAEKDSQKGILERFPPESNMDWLSPERLIRKDIR